LEKLQQQNVLLTELSKTVKGPKVGGKELLKKSS